jgi:MFS family permease
MSLFQTIYDLPRRVPFFYGWCIVFASIIGVIASIPGQTMGVSVFTESLMEAVGITRQQISLAYGIGTTTSGLLLVKAGQMIDRHSVRPIMVTACIGLGTVLILMANIGHVTHAITGVFPEKLTTPISVVIMTFTFFTLRFVGQGLMSMTPRVMLGKWWDRRRGLITGIIGIFTAFAFSSAPKFLAKLIEWNTWHGAYYLMAGIIGIGVATISFLLFREKPEDFGLVPDGHLIDLKDGEDEKDRELVHFTLSETRRNYGFWVFCLAFGLHGLVLTGITFHILALSKEAGLTEQQGLSIFIPMAFISVFANFTGGWISDRMKLKYIVMFMLAMQSLGTFSFIHFDDPTFRVLTAIGYGFGGGLWGALINVTWPRYFGTNRLGAISGQSASVMVIMSAIGPYIFAASLETFGSFTPGLILCGISPILILLLAIPVQNPQPNAPF